MWNKIAFTLSFPQVLNASIQSLDHHISAYDGIRAKKPKLDKIGMLVNHIKQSNSLVQSNHYEGKPVVVHDGQWEKTQKYCVLDHQDVLSSFYNQKPRSESCGLLHLSLLYTYLPKGREKIKATKPQV